MRGTHEVTLPGGETIAVRPIRASDKALLREAFEHLGPESRYRRFLGVHNRLTPRELRYFTEVDHRSHEAIVAIDPASGEGIGVARYVVLQDEPDTAEIAVAVIDDWQERGVGTALLRELSRRANAAGVARFRATMFTSNRRMRDLLSEVGRPRVARRGAGLSDYELDLS